MGAKREDDAGAKDLERPSATLDQRRQRAPLQDWRVQRQEPGHHHSERDEVKDTVRREAGLIVGIEWLQDPTRNKAAEIWRLNGRRHDKSEKKVADRKPERGLRREHRLKRPGAAKGRPCAQNKQQLPGERVEIPGDRRRCGKIPAKMPA